MNSTNSKKAKGPAVAPASPLKTGTSTKKFSAKSTATEAQLDRLKHKLRARPHHTIELRHCGIHHPAGRIQDLEARGFVIDVARVTAVDAEGFTHAGIALYSLVTEPDGERQE